MTIQVVDAGGTTRTIETIDDLVAFLTTLHGGASVLDFGPGTGGTRTPRVAIDTGELNVNGRTDPTHGAPVTPVAAAAYLAVFGGLSTHIVKNGGGAAGDYLESIVCVVTTPGSSQVQIKDGAGSNPITILPNGVGAGVGTYSIPLGFRATAADGWTIVCSAGVAGVVTGDF